MNFFVQQERTRRATVISLSLLALWSAIALAILYVICVYGVAFLTLDWRGRNAEEALARVQLYVAAAFVVCTAIAVAVVWFRMRYLDPATIARRVGARAVSGTEGPYEKRLINVIQEMAIAFGLPVPRVFVLSSEATINAFTTGLTPQVAVLIISRGALELLTRDQLQGVVAHELGHVRNGDIRLNTWVFGFVNALRLFPHGAQSLLSNPVYKPLRWALLAVATALVVYSNKNGGAAVLILLLFPVWMTVMVVIVAFTQLLPFGASLCFAMMSRQREFLADASAIQATRYPEGLAGALRKIARSGIGSNLNARYARGVTHMAFANALSGRAGSWRSSHPTITRRLRRLGFVVTAGEERVWKRRDAARAAMTAEVAAELGIVAAAAPMTPAASSEASESQPSVAFDAYAARLFETLVEIRPSPATARRFIANIEHKLRERLQHRDATIAAAVALVVDESTRANAAFWSSIERKRGQPFAEEVRACIEALDAAGEQSRLNLLELINPGLVELDATQKRELLELLRASIKQDGRVDWREYCYFVLISRVLEPQSGMNGARSLKAESRALEVVLRVVLRANEPERVAQAMQAAFAAADLAISAVPNPAMPAVADFLRALQRLNALLPLEKARAVRAIGAAIGTDGRATVEEVELLRVVGAALDCPVPMIAVTADAAHESMGDSKQPANSAPA